MKEKDVESYLRSKVKSLGGLAYKFESPGNAGVPDRIIIFPRNNIHFVELKAPKQRPRAQQINQMRRLSHLGCFVWVLDSKEAVDDFLEKVVSS